LEEFFYTYIFSIDVMQGELKLLNLTHKDSWVNHFKIKIVTNYELVRNNLELFVQNFLKCICILDWTINIILCIVQSIQDAVLADKITLISYDQSYHINKINFIIWQLWCFMKITHLSSRWLNETIFSVATSKVQFIELFMFLTIHYKRWWWNIHY
jgi:hypothetical protein